MTRDLSPTPSVVRAAEHEPDAAHLALALAAGHLTEAAISAHRYSDQHDVANRLGVSKARVNRLVLLTTLAPDIQEHILHLEHGIALCDLSERAVRVLVAAHPDWNIQRWWWSLLAQPFDPDWLVDGLPSRATFPSGRRCRREDRAIGDLPLVELAALVVRLPGRRETGGTRETMLTALAGDGVGAPSIAPEVALALAMPPAKLAAEFERLHSLRTPSRHRDYLRRRVVWAVQAAKHGGLPKPISGRVMELRDHLPDRWREVFASVARVHVTRAHRVERSSSQPSRPKVP